MKSVAIFITLIAASCAIDLKCFTEGHAVSRGQRTPCINDCVNSVCVTDSSLVPRPCVSDNTTALIYNTYQLNHDIPLCKSRCGKFGKDHDWCYVDETGSKWDYCNAQTEIKWYRNQRFTLKGTGGGPCKGSCVQKNGEYVCDTYWGTQASCNPKIGLNHIVGVTKEGVICPGECNFHGETYKWCWDMNREAKHCALPAATRAESLWTYDQLAADQALPTRYSPDNVQNSRLFSIKFITDAARMLESNRIHYMLNLNGQSGNSVTQHTVRQGYVTLPLVVRARITPSHLKGDLMNNLELMGGEREFAIEDLVPYSLGGPMEVYNVVPRMRPLNLGSAGVKERAIRLFLSGNSKRRAAVELLIVVLYKDESSTRPHVVGAHATYFLDDSRVEEHFDVFLNADTWDTVASTTPRQEMMYDY